MIDRMLALLALLVLVGFIGIVIAFVPALDLIIVAAITVALAGYDFYRSTFRGDGGGAAG